MDENLVRLNPGFVEILYDHLVDRFCKDWDEQTRSLLVGLETHYPYLKDRRRYAEKSRSMGNSEQVRENAEYSRTLTVTKIFHFCYGHHLPDYDGPCSQEHGHNGVLEVEVGLPNLDENTYHGFVMDFADLKCDVNSVLEQYDHTYLNKVHDKIFNDKFPPTAENIVNHLWGEINVRIPCPLVRLRLWETPTSYAELRQKPRANI